jgi:hypothetical protein
MEKPIEEYISVNSNNLITAFVWSGLLDKAKCGELLEIIKQCSVEIASIEVLQEIRQEIKELPTTQRTKELLTNGGKVEIVDRGVDDLPAEIYRYRVLEIIDSHISALSEKENKE